MAPLVHAGPVPASLHDAVGETGPLPADEVLRFARGLAEALQAVHRTGVVHRNLEPATVELTAGRPRIADFAAERIAGTPGCRSPEQWAGGQVGTATDVFALGCLVCFAATGTTPFAAASDAEVGARTLSAEPDLDALPAEIRSLVLWCLAKEPDDRPGLDRLVDQLAEVAPAGVRETRWVRPSRRRVLAAGAVVGAAAGAPLWLVTGWTLPAGLVAVLVGVLVCAVVDGSMRLVDSPRRDEIGVGTLFWATVAAGGCAAVVTVELLEPPWWFAALVALVTAAVTFFAAVALGVILMALSGIGDAYPSEATAYTATGWGCQVGCFAAVLLAVTRAQDVGPASLIGLGIGSAVTVVLGRLLAVREVPRAG